MRRIVRTSILNEFARWTLVRIQTSALLCSQLIISFFLCLDCTKNSSFKSEKNHFSTKLPFPFSFHRSISFYRYCTIVIVEPLSKKNRTSSWFLLSLKLIYRAKCICHSYPNTNVFLQQTIFRNWFPILLEIDPQLPANQWTTRTNFILCSTRKRNTFYFVELVINGIDQSEGLPSSRVTIENLKIKWRRLKLLFNIFHLLFRSPPLCGSSHEVLLKRVPRKIPRVAQLFFSSNSARWAEYNLRWK